MDDVFIALIVSGFIILAFLVGRLGRDKKYVEGYCLGYNDALEDIQSMEQFDKNIQIIVKK